VVEQGKTQRNRKKIDREDRSLSELRAIIERPGTRLPKLSQSEFMVLRDFFKRTQSESGWRDPLTALRYHLVVRHPIPSSFLSAETISRAIVPEDLLKFSSKLAPKVKVTLLQPYLVALKTAIQRHGGNINLATVKLIRDRIKFYQRDIRAQINLNSEDIPLALNELIHVVVTNIKMKRETDRRIAEELAKDFLDLVFASVVANTSHKIIITGLSVMQALSTRLYSEFIERVLDEQPRADQWELVQKSLLERIRDYAVKGFSSDLKELIGSIKSLPVPEEFLTSSLKGLWGKDAAQMEFTVQEMIRSELGIKTKSARPNIEFVDKSERPEVTLVASALMKAWDAKEEGPKAATAFRSLSDVASRVFHLRLGGAVGTEVNVNPNAHEWFNEKRSERVKILRPWVEWNDGKNWKVMIKALVVAVDKTT
jgi:hypothetical protein